MTPLKRIEALNLPHYLGWKYVRHHLETLRLLLRYVETQSGVVEQSLAAWATTCGIGATACGGNIKTLVRLLCACGVATRRRGRKSLVYAVRSDLADTQFGDCTLSDVCNLKELDDLLSRQFVPRDPEWLSATCGGGNTYQFIAIGLATGRYVARKDHPSVAMGVSLAPRGVADAINR